MKDRPNRPSRSVPPTRSAPTSGRARTPQRGGGRQQKQSTRNRQLLAVGALVAIIAVVVGIVLWIDGNRPPEGIAVITPQPNESVGHFRGSATAPVTVTEWSDFQ